MNKEITITLYRSEILYDVESQCYLRGEAVKTDENRKQAAFLQISGSATERNLIFRSMGVAVSDVRSKLSPYLAEIVEERTKDPGARDESLVFTANNSLDDTSDGVVEIKLSMPSNFNQAFLESLKQAVHNYIVDYAIAEWFRLMNSGESALYYEMANAEYLRIKSCAEKRIRTTQRKQSIF